MLVGRSSLLLFFPCIDQECKKLATAFKDSRKRETEREREVSIPPLNPRSVPAYLACAVVLPRMSAHGRLSGGWHHANFGPVGFPWQVALFLGGGVSAQIKERAELLGVCARPSGHLQE